MLAPYGNFSILSLIWEINRGWKRMIQKRTISEEVCTQFAIRGDRISGEPNLRGTESPGNRISGEQNLTPELFKTIKTTLDDNRNLHIKISRSCVKACSVLDDSQNLLIKNVENLFQSRFFSEPPVLFPDDNRNLLIKISRSCFITGSFQSHQCFFRMTIETY